MHILLNLPSQSFLKDHLSLDSLALEPQYVAKTDCLVRDEGELAT